MKNLKKKKKTQENRLCRDEYDAPYKYDAVIYLLNKLLKMSYFIFLHTH